MLKFTACQAQHAELSQSLSGITRGIERECLRVDSTGQMASTPHPAALGSKLTHPWITTDYAEAMLELITPPSQDPGFPLTFLRDLHSYTAQHIDDELLWASSMPCKIGHDIAIADYGQTNEALFKMVYRHGLGLRYGRAMQTIAGVHYNWSLSQPVTDPYLRSCADAHYLGLARNFLRFGWILPYLFGASPVLCQSFLQGRPSELSVLCPGTLFLPYATSLRMSDLGYQNHAQNTLAISFNSLADYTAGLETAIRTPDPYYTTLGVRQNNGWRQLNTNVLQTESEFYAPIRLKRISPQRSALALQTHGVEYVEIRLLDADPFIDVGIGPEHLLFLDALLLMCWCRESPPISPREQSENDENRRRVVTRGRQPGLQLLVHNQEQPLRTLAHELLDDITPFAEMLDRGGQRYRDTLQSLRQRIDNPDCTPSAQVIEAVRHCGGYSAFTMAQSQRHTNALKKRALNAQFQRLIHEMVAQSHAEFQRREQLSQEPFDAYVERYFGLGAPDQIRHIPLQKTELAP